MTMYGADSDELRRLAAEMTQAAEELDSNQNLMSKTLFNISWLGDIASNFAEKWTGVSVPRMNLSTNFLREAAECLDRQAKEQDEASTADGARTCERPGDSGGTYSWDKTGSYDVSGNTDEERGLDVLQQVLDDSGDPCRTAPDEFEIIKLDNGKYIVVLPGVTDLSAWGPWAKDLKDGKITDSPLGLDPEHRSVRDMDYAAMASAGNTDVSNNMYAEYVKRAMEEYNIPPGSDVMLVGHSFGSDTALDLAADPSFNGPGGYNVTHVVAAAYNSEHQMDSVPPGTQVLALQNNGDVVVAAERALQGPSNVTNGARDVVGGVTSLDPGRVVSGAGQAVGGVAQTGKDVVKGTGEFIWNTVTDGPKSAAKDLVTLDEGTYNHGDGQNRIVFAGGTGDDAGHHPDRYSDYVGSTNSEVVKDFAESVAQSGYDSHGGRTAHDVSVVD